MRFSHVKRKYFCNLGAKCLNIGSYCVLCGRPGLSGVDLCANCVNLFRTRCYTGRCGLVTTVCLACGELHQSCQSSPGSEAASAMQGAVVSERELQSLSVHDDYCRTCHGQQSPLLSRVVAPYRYAFPVDHLIKRLKYGKDRQLARVLGILLAEAAAHEMSTAQPPDMIVPMPLHSVRMQRRGFNQAQDIARWCGSVLQIPMSPGSASRIADTGSLAGLSRQERQLRILGAFRAGSNVNGKRIAIVDDVLTTGASARELARELYDSGAASVELWVLARTSSSRESG